VIAAVRSVFAGGTLFLDVRDLAIRRDLPVVARHAATSECGESEESNQTHHRRLPLTDIEQFPYRRGRRFLAAIERARQIRDWRDLAGSRRPRAIAPAPTVIIWTRAEREPVLR
jgi:hypothetical protein